MTIQYFGDLRVPDLQGILGQIRRAAAADRRAGQGQARSKIEYLSLRDRDARTGNLPHPAEGGLAAGKQKKAWHYIELFYNEQGAEDSGYVTEKYLQNLAQQIPGLNLAKWQTDRSNPKFEAEIAADAPGREQQRPDRHARRS